MMYVRVWSMPNASTFKMKPVRELIARFIGSGIGWADPFCGVEKMVQYTNDIDPESPADDHEDARDWMERFASGTLSGVLLDPPYSHHQAVEMYKGRRCNSLTPVYDHAARALMVGGICISFGWSSNGLGMKRGFKIREGMLIAHGGHHNDTIITVEVKIDGPPKGAQINVP